jgi:hypothetical protein
MEPPISSLIAAMRALLDGYESVLAGAGRPPARPALPGARGHGVAVAAGPFATPSELQSFTDALASLPGVAAVSVREYVGDDRVVLEVRLG